MPFCARLVCHENGLSGFHEHGKCLQKDIPFTLNGTSLLLKSRISSLSLASLLSSTSE